MMSQPQQSHNQARTQTATATFASVALASVLGRPDGRVRVVGVDDE
jgi:hypothetical protein